MSSNSDIKSAIKTVIFDLGGVLVRTEDQAPREELARQLGLTRQQLYHHVFDSSSAVQAGLGAISAEQHWENVRQELNLTAEQLPAVRSAFWGGDRLDNELVAFIRSLRPAYKTALLSNAWSDLRGYLVDNWKIADAFDELIISAEVGLVKPKAEIFHLALERLRAAPAEAVFVDDFGENIDGARLAGLHAIHFMSAAQAISELQNLLNGTQQDERLARAE